jgi:hypothetical protein
MHDLGTLTYLRIGFSGASLGFRSSFGWMPLIGVVSSRVSALTWCVCCVAISLFLPPSASASPVYLDDHPAHPELKDQEVQVQVVQESQQERAEQERSGGEAEASAASDDPASQIAGTKRMTATPTATPPVIDGVVDDDVWAQAEVVRDFMQREPDNGQPGSQRTEVRVIYDEEAIYFGFIMFDDDPDGIIASDLRRDSRLRTDDTIAVVLDTFHDLRNGFLFRVNPLGTKYDALLRNEREVNSDWNEKWEAATTISEIGWQAEFAIPWRALRYETGAQTWGIDFKREIRRSNEEVNWANYRRGFQFNSVSQAGVLMGLDNLRLTQRFRLQPYVSGGGIRADATDEPYSEATGDIGIEDFKVQLTSNLTADFTVNTDFAQVEDDTERVNLTRFSLFYPEKREFFLEGANNFAFGTGGGGGFGGGGGHGGGFSLYHSRNIGLFDGEAVPIIYGAKMTGKIGGSTVGFLNVQTNDSEFSPAENYTAMRLRQDVFERSSIGGIFTNVQGGDEHNRVGGLDANFRFLDYLNLGGFVAFADDSEVEDTPYSTYLSGSWNSDLWLLSGSYHIVEPDFKSDLGYIQRTDIKKQDFRAGWNPRPSSGPIRQFRFTGSFSNLTDTGGELMTREENLSANVSFQSGDNIMFNYGWNFERLEYEFEPSEGVIIPIGDYDFSDWFLNFRSFSARPLSASMTVSGGGYFDGTRYSLSPRGTVRFNEKFSLSPGYNYNTVDLPGGSFVTHTGTLRIVYNFNEQWLTNALIQYNSVSGRMSVFARLQYVLNDGFDNIFFVYKQATYYYGSYDGLSDHQLLAKATYSFDF